MLRQYDRSPFPFSTDFFLFIHCHVIIHSVLPRHSNTPFEALLFPSLPSCIWFLILPNSPPSSLFFSPSFQTPAAEVPSGGGEADPVLERQAYLDGKDGAGTG